MGTRRSTPAQVAQCLGGIHFPCSREDLVNYARQRNCSSDVLDTLQRMPDMRYSSMADVFSGVGKVE